MTQDEMIEMAKDAGWSYMEINMDKQRLEAFANLITEKERELLNTVFWAFQEWKEDHISDGTFIDTVHYLRARSQE
jgi:uncharacterized radical SAM superfamily Fe-S cluster-containing enzyme